MTKLNKIIFSRKVKDTKKHRITLNDYNRFEEEVVKNQNRKLFVEKLYKYNSLIYSDIYYCKKSKGKFGIEYQLAIRRVERNQNIVNSNLFFNALSGYTMKDYYENDYYITIDNYKPYYVPDVQGLAMIIKQDEQLKYLNINDFKNIDSSIELISYLRVEPKIEQLLKVGLGKYFRQYNRFNFDKNGFKQKFNINRNDLRFVDSCTLNSLVYKAKFELSDKQFNVYLKFKDFVEIRKLNEKQKIAALHYLTNELERKNGKSEYMKLNNVFDPMNIYQMLSLYNDYIMLARYFNKNLDESYWLLPKKLQIKHDDLMNKKNKILETERLSKMTPLINKIQKLKSAFGIVYRNKFKLFIPSLKEMENIASEFNICLISNEYYKLLAEKESLILFISIDNKIVEVAELKNKSLIQLRGPHNQPTEFHNDILNIIEPDVIPLLNNFKSIELECV